MYIQQTIQWIPSIVISLNLCPFAKREMDNNTVRFKVGEATALAGLTQNPWKLMVF